MDLEKLSEESLTRQPEEVFDIVCKLGEGSYGSVYKALHKETRQTLAIKQVPVDADLQEIIKEISIMQQCDSLHVVKYYGSYFKHTDLWIVMEFCGAGSVLDIMKLRGIHQNFPKGKVKTLTEDEIATVLADTLKGLDYLHKRKKIHRDVKAGNILLSMEGRAKLADFGVAGQLTDTMAKRNTVIGTPFWMAPEVIQEIGYDFEADIWSLGITSLEMAEGKAPYGDIHPMRAIFMIPSKPPPSFNQPDLWSPVFIDFISKCLVKNPADRANASDLLNHNFISSAKPPQILIPIIEEALAAKEAIRSQESSPTTESPTIISDDELDSGTMIQHATMVSNSSVSLQKASELDSSLNTTIVNEGESDTMKRHDTNPSENYRPAFMDHFEKDETSPDNDRDHAAVETQEAINQSVDAIDAQEKLLFQRQLDRIAGRRSQFQPPSPAKPALDNLDDDLSTARIQYCIAQGDFEILKRLSSDELAVRITQLDKDMEQEIEDLRMRYHAKRQPILDAIDQKRKKQHQF